MTSWQKKKSRCLNLRTEVIKEYRTKSIASGHTTARARTTKRLQESYNALLVIYLDEDARFAVSQERYGGTIDRPSLLQHGRVPYQRHASEYFRRILR